MTYMLEAQSNFPHRAGVLLRVMSSLYDWYVVTKRMVAIRQFTYSK